MTSILLIGKPTFKNIDGLSQIGGMVDWLHSREIDTVYWYDPGLTTPIYEDGVLQWVHYVKEMHKDMMKPRSLAIGAKDRKIRLAMIGRNWPVFVNTDTSYLQNFQTLAINWVMANELKSRALPLGQPMVDMVMCLTQNSWDPRLGKGGGWSAIKPLIDWYESNGVPVIYMGSNGLFN